MADFASLCADLLRNGHSIRFAATGPSMSPVIRDGDVVTIEPCAEGELRRWDVVYYATPRGPTLHRVVRLRGSLVEVRGDALDSQGELVPVTAVLGRLVSVCRAGQAVPLSVPVGVRFRRLTRKTLGLKLVTIITRRAAGALPEAFRN
jgi:hypothetical protein